MRSSKAAALLLSGFCFVACALPRLAAAQSGQPEQYLLTGQISVNNQASSRFIARLYFPKNTGKPPLITFADGNGYFEFANVPVGDYLIEVYANGDMFYQKSITLNANFKRDDSIVRLEVKRGGTSWAKVLNNTRLQQRHKFPLQGNEFQGQIAVYVGDIHATSTFSLIVFKTGNETARWQDTDRIDERTLRAALGRERILTEAKLSKKNLTAGFTYNGHFYNVEGTRIETHGIGDDFLYFEIYRKP